MAHRQFADASSGMGELLEVMIRHAPLVLRAITIRYILPTQSVLSVQSATKLSLQGARVLVQSPRRLIPMEEYAVSTPVLWPTHWQQGFAFVTVVTSRQ